MRASAATNELFDVTATDSFENQLDREGRIAKAVDAVISFALAVTMLVSAPFLLQ